MDARDTALAVLTRCRTEDAWADAALKDALDAGTLSRRDAALCTRLVYGVLQNRALLDYHVDSLLTGRRRIRPMLREILRLGAYQILFLDRVPDSAAVNEAVAQAKSRLSSQEAGLVNGVLRNLSRQKESLVQPRDYSILYSHPAALVDLMKQSLGKRLGTVLAADNTASETAAQWNPLRGTEPALLDTWRAEGVTFAPHPWLAHCYLLSNTGDLEQLSSFQWGLFQIQDPAARLSVQVLGLKPEMKVLDLCAAPGGKSLAAAMEMENRGSILSCDLYDGKLPQITTAARRLGVEIISTERNDSALFRPDWAGQFDAVIADVPCSGLGVIRKKPDIRYRDLGTMAALPELQGEILRQAARYVRPGGAVLYSTCTILRRENEDVVRQFLAAGDGWQPEPMILPAGLREESPGMLTLYQGINDCDGFFMARLRRQGL